MFERLRARRAHREARARHHALMNAADRLVGIFGTLPATPSHLVLMAFRCAIEVSEEDAARYLDAARVARAVPALRGELSISVSANAARTTSSPL